MRRAPFHVLTVMLVLALASAGLAEAQSSRGRILERGWQLTRYPECGYQGPVPTGQNAPPRDQIGDIECSPGGPWGAYVYLAVTESGLDSDSDPYRIQKIERVDFQGNSELYGLPGESLFLSLLTQLSFTPPGWRGGDLLFLTHHSSSQGLSIIRAMDPQLVTAFYLGHMFGGVESAAVDPTGDFGFDVFWNSNYSYPPDSGIFRVDASGNETFFTDLIFGEMRFGPGGEWGGDLYVGGFTVAPDGTATPFPVDFTEFTWAEGPGLGGDMFARIRGEDPAMIFRVRPDGTFTPFARNLPGELTGCDDRLWIAGNGCFVTDLKRGGPRQRAPLPLRLAGGSK